MTVSSAILDNTALTSMSQQYLAIPIGNAYGFQTLPKRVFQVVDTQLREPKRARLFVELLPFFGGPLPNQPQRFLQHPIHWFPGYRKYPHGMLPALTLNDTASDAV